MQVFRTYHKIILRKFPSIAVLLVAYLVLSLLYSHADSVSEGRSFTDLELQITIFNEDVVYGKSTELVHALKSYLSRHAEIVTVQDHRNDLQNALFTNEIHAAIRIPKGFTANFLQGNSMAIEQMSKPDSPEAVYIQMHINKYLNTTRLYADNMEEYDRSRIAAWVQEDLSNEITVKVQEDQNLLFQVTGNMVNHYNFLGFYLLFSIISGVGMTMMVFNKPEIIKRNNLAPLSISNRNFQLLLGNASYVLLCWGLGMIISIFSFRSRFSLPLTMLFSLNALCFAISCLSIGFFIGKNVSNKNTFNSLVAIIILGMTFLGGLFIPLELMGQRIINVAQFTPVYWFIKANNSIQNIDVLSMESFIPIGWEMAVVLGFGFGIFALTILISKTKFSRLHSQ